jgi:integrase
MSVYKEKGSKTYVIDFTVDGRRYRENTGMTSIRAAKDLQDQRRTTAKNDKAGYKKRERPQSLAVDAAKWLEGKSELAPRSKRIEEYNLRHLLSILGEMRSINIGPADILRYQERRTEQGASNRTVSLELGTLRAIFKRQGCWDSLNKAMKQEQVKLALPEGEQIGRNISHEEETALLDACSKSRSRSLRPLAELALQTGARYGTLRMLTWGNIDFAKRTIKFGKDKTKAGSHRTVPLTQRALAVMEVWASNFPNRQVDHFVFPSELYGLFGEEGYVNGQAHPYSVDPTKPMGSWKTAWNTARKTAGVNCRFHDLRHTAVTRLIENGVPITMVGKLVGWSANSMIAMATRYSHHGVDSLRQAMEAAGNVKFATKPPVFPPEAGSLVRAKIQ